MWNKGSITTFFCLILTLILSLISSFLVLAKMSSARAQIAMAMDLAMYSEMAKYDQELFQEYHVFFMDGGLGSYTLQLGNILDELQMEITYGLSPSKDKKIPGTVDFIDLEVENSAITGYSLATDQKGGVFRNQAVQYMKKTQILQGVSSLTWEYPGGESDVLGAFINRIGIERFLFSKQEMKGGNLMEELTALAETLSAKKLEELPISNLETDANEQILAIDKEKVKEAKKVLLEVGRIKKSSILQKVIKTPEEVSTWSIGTEGLVSHRDCQEGMGVIEAVNQEKVSMEQYYFQEYLLQNVNHYRQTLHTTGPAYGLEYILAGKTSDVENLETIANRLLLIRQVANTLYLYTDAEKKANVETVSAMAAMLFGLPDLQPVLEAALILSWAYVESLVDVRGLFSGKCVPLWKNSASWQVEEGDILAAISDPDSCAKNSGSTDYESYLSMMLLVASEEEKTMRCLDVVEQTIRALPGKDGFSMDHAIGMLEVQMYIRAEKKKTFEITERRSYENM